MKRVRIRVDRMSDRRLWCLASEEPELRAATRVYVGTRTGRSIDVVVVPLTRGRFRVLEPRHGMTFDWSQLSPGSLLLAQALLDDATATANHGRVLRRFQADVVAAMPKRRFVMTDAEIRSWRAGAGSA